MFLNYLKVRWPGRRAICLLLHWLRVSAIRIQ